MLGEKYHELIAAFQQWSEQRAMRKWGRLPEEALPAPAPLLPRRRQWQAFGFAGGVFLAALTAPGVGRITRQEVSLSLPLGDVQAIKSLWTGAATSTGENPQQARGQSLPPALATDVEVQAAKAMFAPDASAIHIDSLSTVNGVYNSAQETALRKQNLLHSLPAIRAVMTRFPASSLPRAAFLTRVCNFDYPNVITDHWIFDTRVTPATPSPAVRLNPTGPNDSDRNLLKQCVQVAQEGERLEPDNVYFPVMLAHLHFAAYDNQTALADIDRASRKPRWEDYNSALIRGACRLHDAQLGVSSSVLHQTTFDTAFFFYSNFLVETARHLQLLASKQEHAGNIEGGIALRGRMMRIGATIRDQARGRFVSGPGEDMFLFACIRPKIEKGKYVLVPVSAQQPTDYLHFLRHQGYTAEADWVQGQLKYFTAINPPPVYQDDTAAGDQEDLPGYDPNYESDYERGQMAQRMAWAWVVGFCVLAEITTLLLIGGLAAWRNYRGRFGLKRPRPFARPVVWGIVLALTILTCALIVTAFGLAQGLAVAMDTLPLLGLLCLTLLVLGLMRGARDSALTALLTFTIVCTLIGTAFVQIGSALLKANQLQTASSLYEIIHGTNLRDIAGLDLNVTLCTLAPLLLLVVWMAIRSRIRRVPLGWGVGRGLSTALLPLLSLLLIGYAWIGMATTRAEAQAESTLQQMLDNENRAVQGLYREARRNAQQKPIFRSLRLLTGDIHATNVFPLPDASKSSTPSR